MLGQGDLTSIRTSLILLPTPGLRESLCYGWPWNCHAEWMIHHMHPETTGDSGNTLLICGSYVRNHCGKRAFGHSQKSTRLLYHNQIYLATVRLFDDVELHTTLSKGVF